MIAYSPEPSSSKTWAPAVTTSAPLIWFAAAAQRLKLSTVGLMQSLAPSCLLALGVLALAETERVAEPGYRADRERDHQVHLPVPIPIRP